MAKRHWQILLVDDEEDVHTITALVLKQKRWRNRRFKLTSAYSRKEAIEILSTSSEFHVAVLDVVMETDNAGLDLCDFIRRNCPNSMRIILRTGQPGLAPEEKVLNDFDIDYYLAKSDATPGKLYNIIRACIRSSQDISTLLAYGKQLQSFTKTLQSITSVRDLVVFMHEALAFLELKHYSTTIFNYDLANLDDSFIMDDHEAANEQLVKDVGQAMQMAHDKKLMMLEAHPAKDMGLSDSSFMIPFETHEETQEEEEDIPPVLGCLMFDMSPEYVSEKATQDFLADAALFIDNWCIAYATLRLRERLAKEQLLRDQMYYERMESIATMVTGVAHELNTPLGVARTANSMVTELVTNLLQSPPEDDEEREELQDDLEDACNLMTKNLERAQRLIQSFKKLSASQLSDEQMDADLENIVRDCLETMRPDLKKKGIISTVHPQEDVKFAWNGYPGHLSQVIINLIQNTVRYAYPDIQEGKIDVFLRENKNKGGYRIEFVDYGKGVARHILPRLFDAFVTSGRNQGGTGLGLAIVHNIVVNLLGGNISCESELGEGTRFLIDLPKTVDVEETKHISARKHSPSTVSKFPHNDGAE
jgi:signal transduction histidine kinase/CheY-like chemotaxis protein